MRWTCMACERTYPELEQAERCEGLDAEAGDGTPRRKRVERWAATVATLQALEATVPPPCPICGEASCRDMACERCPACGSLDCKPIRVDGDRCSETGYDYSGWYGDLCRSELDGPR